MSRSRSHSMHYSRSNGDDRRQKESITELKHVYTSIKYDWPQCLEENANPIAMAIQLLDDTSVGLAHKKHDFDRISQETKEALRQVVAEHHDVFNNSIGSYRVLLNTLQESQNNSTSIRDMVESSTQDSHDRSDVLNELVQTTLRYGEMIEVLEAMETVNEIPQVIDQLVLNKKIHQVYDVIANGYAIAEKYNLWSLPAMAASQAFLEVQSNNLYDMIIEELQNEIYLKSVVDEKSSDRNFSWLKLIQSTNPQLASFKTLVTQSANLEQYIYNSANLDIPDVAAVFGEDASNFVFHQLPKLHAHYSSNETNVDYSILLDANLNSSSESFYYIYMLLFTASKLNRLQLVLEVLMASIQQELHGLISRTTEECKLKDIVHLNKLSKIQHYDYSSTIEVLGANTFNDASVVVLEDLFGSIFTKCLIVLQKHKIISVIVDKIESSQNIPHGGALLKTYNFGSIWNTMTKELENLMRNYTHDVSGPTEVIHQNNLHDVFLKKELFKFEDVSHIESSKTTEEMKNVLSNMFPGFVVSEEDKSKVETPYIKSENFNALVEVVVPKNIFNMRIMLEFFLIFTTGSQSLFWNFSEEPDKKNDRTSLNFFSGFMRNTFITKFKDSLDRAFTEFVEDKDASLTQNNTRGNSSVSGLKASLVSIDILETTNQVLTRPGNTHSAAKIYQNALDFKRLLMNTCATLNTSLNYRKDISDLVLSFLKRFSDAYNSFYKELLSQGDSGTYGSKPITALQKWLGNQPLIEMSCLLLQQDPSSEDTVHLLKKEVDILLFNQDSKTEIFDISKEDFLDGDSFNQVCYLLLTTAWILSWLPSVKKEMNYDVHNDNSSTVQLSTIDKLKHDWTFLENGRSNYAATDDTKHIYLALNSSRIKEFDDIINNFEVIRDRTLLALRYDLRAKAIYFLGKSFKETDWVPSTEPGDSDQFIGQFNKEVFAVDNKLNSVMNETQRESVLAGLPEFIDTLLIRGSYALRKVNNNGIKRIMLNIFTLQQMLKSIMKQVDSIDFTKSSRYFELFTLKEQAFLNEIKKNTSFSKDDYLNLARLQYSDKLADGRGSNFYQTKYNELVRNINELI